MKKCFWLCLLLCLLPVWAFGQEDITFTAWLPTTGGVETVVSKIINNEPWLLLPAHADRESLALSQNGGEPFLLEGTLCEDEDYPGSYITEIALDEESSLTLHIMQSANIRALYLHSDDPVNHGRKWVEAAPRHENEATGRMAIVDAHGVQNHADTLTQIRGRGNFTWANAKKPYQFKLENRFDLLRTGDRAEANRTWVLLAEVGSQSLLFNRIALDFALDLGIAETSHSEHVDLYYDGDYCGTYLLCEKVEVNPGRIEIDGLPMESCSGGGCGLANA